jgi:hypothetical protein
MKDKVVMLEIYHWRMNKLNKVEVELFNDKETCRKFVNKYFEQINYENNEVSTYEDGFIFNLYEEYSYIISEKEIK